MISHDLRDRRKNPNGYRSREADDAEDALLGHRKHMMGLARTVPDPTALLVVDEADRVKIAGPEQGPEHFRSRVVGLVLIGMPGIEKRLARSDAVIPPATA